MTDEEKKVAEEAAAKLKKEREAIKVTTNEVVIEEKEVEKEVEKEEDDNKEIIEEKDDKEEQIDKSEKTEEELEAEKKEAQTQKEKDRIQRRIDKEVGKRKVLEDEIKALKAKLEAKDEDILTEDEVEKRSEEKANNKIIEREFLAACDRLFQSAVKIDKDFKKKIDAVADDIGPIPGQMIGILDDLGNGGAILSYLANNVDEAETIYALTPGKMGIELSKLSTKLEKKPPPPKDISKVPDPGESLGGGNNRTNTIVLSDKDDMETWIQKRNKQVAQRNEMKRQGMR